VNKIELQPYCLRRFSRRDGPMNELAVIEVQNV
jgi:hypothetical protein